MQKVKASSLILDYTLYPRHTINAQHVADLAQAQKAGATLPPVIADRRSHRIIDGFHRATVALRGGPDAMIAVEWRDYENDGAAFLDAMLLNHAHGQRLTHYDVARCIAVSEDLHLTTDMVATALSMTVERLTEIKLHKMALGDGAAALPIKSTVGHFAGKRMNARQRAAAKKVQGVSQLFLIRQVINLVAGDLVDHSSEPVLKALAELVELLQPFRRKRIGRSRQERTAEAVQ